MNVNQRYSLNLFIRMFEVISDFILINDDSDIADAAVLILILRGRRGAWRVIGVEMRGILGNGGRWGRKGRTSVSGFIR